jgi:hypothetical protein
MLKQNEAAFSANRGEAVSMQEKQMNTADIGKLIVSIGGVLVVAGLLVWVGGDKISWIGNLPGDVRIERPGFSIYFPITTMILFSLVLSGLMWAINRFSQ